jgi:small-conductance mechanosensitive channel
LGPIVQLVAPDHTVQILGIRMFGMNANTGKKLLFSAVLLGVLWLLKRAASALLRVSERRRVRFWSAQSVRIVTTIVLITGLISIWFTAPGQIGSAATFITAGLAVASQRAITALFGYFIILRGKTFHVGNRIVMGGVRGDVIALGFMQTTVMEMGEPPGAQADAPSQWVQARQYTGRIVTITNDKIFDQPVYNYTREFPYIWEEMHLPIPYSADHKAAEEVILQAARLHTTRIAELSQPVLDELQKRYAVEREDLEPRVFYRLTDNWCEMAVRFIVEDHGIRAVKDKMSRDILDGLRKAHIGIASGTYDVVGLPEVRVRIADQTKDGG